MIAAQNNLQRPSRRQALQEMLGTIGGIAVATALGGTAFAEGPQSREPPTSEPTGNATVDGILGFFEAAPLTTTRITDRIAMLSGPGGNMLVLAGPEGALIVDTGVYPTAAKVFAAPQAFAGKPVNTVVNTHWRFDHVGGNAYFADHGGTRMMTGLSRKRTSGICNACQC